MSKKYIYKIKCKFKKNSDLLLKYGFAKYEDDLGEEKLFAMPINLPENGTIFQYLKHAMEKIYINATEEEKHTDFKNYEFKEFINEKGKKDCELLINDSIRDEFSKANLCFYENGEGAWCLFINAPDHVQYYNAITLEESCKDIIDNLINLKIIYKARNKIQ